MTDGVKLKNSVIDNLKSNKGIEYNGGIYDLVRRKHDNVGYKDAMSLYIHEIRTTGTNVHKNRVCSLLKKYFR